MCSSAWTAVSRKSGVGASSFCFPLLICCFGVFHFCLNAVPAKSSFAFGEYWERNKPQSNTMATAIRIPLMPLADITNMQQTQANKMQPLTRTCDISPYSTRATSVESTALSPEVWTPQAMTVAADDDVIKVVQHDPYNWKCLPDESDAAAVNAVAVQRVHLMHMQMQQFMLQQQAAAAAAAMVSAASASNVAAAAAPQRAGRRRSSVGPASESHETKDAAEDAAPPTPTEPAICRALVQFKCRQSEFSCHFPVEKGQYVVVQGDRGIDIGAVNRINTDAQKSYIERTGPSGAILRHATQREVDFWATRAQSGRSHCTGVLSPARASPYPPDGGAPCGVPVRQEEADVLLRREEPC